MLNKLNIGPQRQIAIIYFFLTIVTLAVFWQVNQFDFVNLDDLIYVKENNNIQAGITLEGVRWAFSTTYAEFWHPLTWLSLMIDYQLYGLNAGGYHLTNLILHIMSAILLFWLFNRMTGAIWRSAFLAAIFSLHPLRVESVAWIAERKDVLSAFFWMMTLCLYVYYTEKPVIKRYLLVVFGFACALMSKPMVVTLPVIMILLDYWPLGRFQSRKTGYNLTNVMPISTEKGKQKTKFKKRAMKENISLSDDRKLSETKVAGIIPLWQLWEKTPFFVLSAVFSILTIYAQYDMNIKVRYPLRFRIANVPVSFVTYLEKTFWPHNLALGYSFSHQLPFWQILGSSLLIIVISVVIIAAVKRLPHLFVGWLWYAITILPIIGIIPVAVPVADRYIYLPSIGITIMLIWSIPLLIQREEMLKKIIFPAGIAVLAILAVLTWQQCGYWKNSSKLFNHALQVTKNNYIAHNGRGTAYYELGNYQSAIEDYSKAITLNPDYDSAYFNRGATYDQVGQYLPAIEDYNKAIILKPDYADAFYNRGNAYVKLGQYQPAIEDYNKAISLKKDFTNAYANRAAVYFNQGKKELVCDDAQKACELGKCRILDAARVKGYCR